jgi:hypothetical protein
MRRLERFVPTRRIASIASPNISMPFARPGAFRSATTPGPCRPGTHISVCVLHARRVE